jgi:hypothetical protein
MRLSRTRSGDPARTRLSDHFLLSDFLGCHSVYTKGFKNVFADSTGSKIAEGKHLCESLLEGVLEEYGPISISYGYISPELSRRIVTYQNPDIPSYHRWDKGAAADIWIHAGTKQKAPIHLAHEIDETYDYSRMITYSESPYICVATQKSEGSSPRKAFYENRYVGKPKQKPEFITKSANFERRKKEAEDIILVYPWEGAGYPTYHGGGFMQYQHRKISKFSVVSDFLYSSHAITEGIPNAIDCKKKDKILRHAGKFYDKLLYAIDVPRISIVRGYESFRFNDYPKFSWKDHFALELIPPSYVTKVQLADAAESFREFVESVEVSSDSVIVIGRRPE